MINFFDNFNLYFIANFNSIMIYIIILILIIIIIIRIISRIVISKNNTNNSIDDLI